MTNQNNRGAVAPTSLAINYSRDTQYADLFMDLQFIDVFNNLQQLSGYMIAAYQNHGTRLADHVCVTQLAKQLRKVVTAHKFGRTWISTLRARRSYDTYAQHAKESYSEYMYVSMPTRTKILDELLALDHRVSEVCNSEDPFNPLYNADPSDCSTLASLSSTTAHAVLHVMDEMVSFRPEFSSRENVINVQETCRDVIDVTKALYDMYMSTGDAFAWTTLVNLANTVLISLLKELVINLLSIALDRHATADKHAVTRIELCERHGHCSFSHTVIVDLESVVNVLEAQLGAYSDYPERDNDSIWSVSGKLATILGLFD